MANFLDVLHERIVVGDGATGTYLYELGVPLNHCLEELNMTRPELVTQAYRAYADAGAEVIETNSFGANRLRLARFGLEYQVRELNARAAQVAREAVKGRGIFVGGSVGPLSLRPADGELSADERRELFREQIGALLEGGCDLIFLETFTVLEELLLALEAFRGLSKIPVVTSLAVSEEGRLASGQSFAESVKILRAAGADIVGINGTCGPQACVHLLSQLAVEEGELLSVFPNAGKPEFYEGRFNYAASAAYFAETLPRWVEEGARLIGGDYGTRPEHIAAMAAVARTLRPVRIKKIAAPVRPRLEVVSRASAAAEEVSILDLLKTQTVSIVELDSPKTLAMDKFLTGAKALKEAGAAALTLADNSLAILRMSNFAAAIRLREEVGITPLLHLACRDRNLLGLQSEVMGLGTLGFRHVLAVTGDPAKVGDHPGATSVYDLNSLGLIKLLAGMNRGVNAVGKSLNGTTKFIIGCAFNPNALNLDSQMKKLESKLAAGAQYVMTQPVFDAALARKTAARLRPLGVPVFLGVMPLLSSRNAEFLHNEVPGIKIDEAVRERLRHCGDDASATRIGLEVARAVREVALEVFGGVYLITPFLRYEVSVDLLS
jgi:methionine synthase I (cobalamin-dependent)/5,10-methylenetetrahydrofolate reductase